MRQPGLRNRGWLLALLAAYGCDDAGDPDGAGVNSENSPVTIAFLEHENPTYGLANGVGFAEYKKAHPNVTVAVTTVLYSSVTSSLNVDLKGDTLPYDLVQIPPSWVCSFAENLAEVPADVVTLSEAQNLFFAAPLAGSTCNGKLKGIPVEYNLEYGGVIVNRDKYEAKFPNKTPGWATWAEFIAEAKALTEYDAMGVPKANGLDIDPSWAQPTKHIFFSQILQRGGSYWAAAADNTFDFSTPAARESLAAMVDWIAKDKVMFPSLIPATQTFVLNRLLSGATGYGWSDPSQPLSIMGYAGTWSLGAMNNIRPPQNKTTYDFHPLPPMVGTTHKFVQNSGWAFAVPRSSKNQRVAWDIVKSMALSAEAMRKWSSVTTALPALRANGSAAAAASDPLLAKVQPLLEFGQWVGYVPAGAIESVEGTILSNYFAAAQGTKSIDQALADMQRSANEALTGKR
jgi:multiple sugar transport system substrate-binding protein